MAYMRGKHYVYSSGENIHITGGANFPMDVFDELVVMRYAELVAEKSVKNVEKRAIQNNQGNFGCDALCKKYGSATVSDMII